MRKIILIVHNVRSAHNVGSLLRTADGLGVSKVFISGYSPYPQTKADSRLPHIVHRVQGQIQKTALGAEKTVDWYKIDDLDTAVAQLQAEGYLVAALEQTPQAKNLDGFKPPEKIAVIVGNEVDGIDGSALGKADVHLRIPMHGRKESFNVAVAGAIALYHLRYLDRLAA